MADELQGTLIEEPDPEQKKVRTKKRKIREGTKTKVQLHALLKEHGCSMETVLYLLDHHWITARKVRAPLSGEFEWEIDFSDELCVAAYFVYLNHPNPEAQPIATVNGPGRTLKANGIAADSAPPLLVEQLESEPQPEPETAPVPLAIDYAQLASAMAVAFKSVLHGK